MGPSLGETSSTPKWSSGVLSDGIVYSIPWAAVQILRIDPGNDSVTLVGPVFPQPYLYGSGVLSGNGLIYAIPFDADRVLRFDPRAEPYAAVPVGPTLPASVKWREGVLSGDGSIYALPLHGAVGVSDTAGSTPGFSSPGPGGCSGRNELDGSGANTLDGCLNLCANDASCISFEFESTGNHCQMSTSCTEAIYLQEHQSDSSSWRLYVKTATPTATTTTQLNPDLATLQAGNGHLLKISNDTVSLLGALPPLSGGNDAAATDLQACTGECDSDSQCAAGLACFQRSNGETVPGCTGSGLSPSWDYCYYPYPAPVEGYVSFASRRLSGGALATRGVMYAIHESASPNVQVEGVLKLSTPADVTWASQATMLSSILLHSRVTSP